MIFVDVNDPVRNVWDTGQSEQFALYPGSRIALRHSAGSGMDGTWEVLTQVSKDVVLLKRPQELPQR